MLSENGSCGELATLRVPLPVEPSILLTGLLPQECSVFKSAMSPIKLTFSAEPNDLDVLPMGTPRSQSGSDGKVCETKLLSNACILESRWLQAILVRLVCC